MTDINDSDGGDPGLCDRDPGDLGLGDGLKPGGLRNDSPTHELSGVLLTSGSSFRENREDSYSDSDIVPTSDIPSKTTRFLQRIRRRQKSRIVTNPESSSVKLDLCSNNARQSTSDSNTPVMDSDAQIMACMTEYKGIIPKCCHFTLMNQR